MGAELTRAGHPAWEVVAAAQGGSSAAFADLYLTYRGEVAKAIRKTFNDQALIEDLTHETFARAFRRLNSVKDQGRSPMAWLYTIARNLCFDTVKSSRYKLEVYYPHNGVGYGTAGGSADPFAHAPGAPSVERTFQRSEDSRDLARYISRLSPNHQAVIRLRFTEDRSVLETAAILGINEGACKALQHRAVIRLRTLMAADGYDGPGAWATGDTVQLRAAS